MNETTTLPSRKKSPSAAMLGNGKPARQKSGHVPAKDSSEAHSRLILAKLVRFRNGDFSVRLPGEWDGTDGRIAEVFNQIATQEDRITKEVARLSRVVGKEGRLMQRMMLPGAIGGWASKVSFLNTLIDDLVRPTAEIARTIGAVAKGDLGQSMELEVDGRTLRGEFLRSAKLINTMIEQLSVFTSEVTRVAREVGTEGKLGGQARVKGVLGVWKDLTDSVNAMATNLTAQVRNIATVTTAVARGDLSRKITVDVKGEILELKETINTMVDQRKSRDLRAEVTERRRAEEQLRELNETLEQRVTERTEALRFSEARYRALIQALPAALYTTDERGRITLYNQAAIALWGREPEIGKDLWCGSWKIYRPDGTPLPLEECPMAVTLRQGRAIRGEEIVIERADGTRRHVMPHPEPMYADGVLIGAINMLIDVTDLQLAERAMAHLAAIVMSTEDAIVSKNLQGIVTSWNGAAERLFGYTAEEMIGQPVNRLIPPDRHDEEPGILERIGRGESIEHYETIRRRKDGTDFPISLTVSPLIDHQGKIIGASKIARNITEQKRVEEALRDRDRYLDGGQRSLEETDDGVGRIQQGAGRIFLFSLARLAGAAAHHRCLQPHPGRRSWPSFER